jgi:hypothetical protein
MDHALAACDAQFVEHERPEAFGWPLFTRRFSS